MARTNVKTKADQVFTHEGGRAVAGLKPFEQLKRSVLACFLWESEFYEDGQSIADRIAAAAEKCKPEDVAALAVTARKVHNLRHAPLLLLKVLARIGAGKPGLVSGAIEQTISRADELSEFLSIYMGDKRRPLAGQVKKGLARAFGKFDAYALAKYNRDGKFKLRDVLFLCHAKPKDAEQKALWERLINNDLPVPDTWEVALSGGADKKEAFERLLKEGKLGYLALLRNLRNMEQAGVDRELIKTALLARKGAQKVLPFRYVAAAKAAPVFEPWIDQAMLAGLAQLPKLSGTTLVIVDVSGSMYDSPLSHKSDMDRALAACALGSIAREICDVPLVYATAGSDAARVHKTKMVPARRGMALVDAIYGMCVPLGGGGIFLNQVMRFCRDQHKTESIDRVIVITDEQDCSASLEDAPSKAPLLGRKNYMVNVASAQNGVGYRNGWTHIDGFSEGVLKYIHAIEAGAL